MKIYLAFLLICTFHNVAKGQQEKEWTFMDYLEAGIKILEVADKAVTLYNHIDQNDSKAVITFVTNEQSEVKVYVNGQFVGSINTRKGYSLKLSPGHYTCKAIFADGSTFYEQLTAVKGSQYNVRLDKAISNISYAVRKVYGSVSGNRVNFRTSPTTESKNNVIRQLNHNESLEILDKQIITQRNDYRITIRSCYFTPLPYRSPHTVHGGIAMKVIRQLEDGRCLVSFDTKEGTMTGYIHTKDLSSIQSSIWYKVKMDGTIGWIFGDYVIIKQSGC